MKPSFLACGHTPKGDPVSLDAYSQLYLSPKRPYASRDWICNQVCDFSLVFPGPQVALWFRSPRISAITDLHTWAPPWSLSLMDSQLRPGGRRSQQGHKVVPLLTSAGAFGRPLGLPSRPTVRAWEGGPLGACATLPLRSSQFHHPPNLQVRTSSFLEPLKPPRFLPPRPQPSLQALSSALGADNQAICFATSFGPPFTHQSLSTLYPCASNALTSNIVGGLLTFSWEGPALTANLITFFPIIHPLTPPTSHQDIRAPP